MSSPSRLGITADLAGDLTAWQKWWQTHATYGKGEASDPAERAGWDRQGLALASRLAEQTGAEVVYQWPRGPNGRDPDCSICGPPRSGDLGDL